MLCMSAPALFLFLFVFLVGVGVGAVVGVMLVVAAFRLDNFGGAAVIARRCIRNLLQAPTFGGVR